jgi:quercetin dioxygenase-like cupin family protein
MKVNRIHVIVATVGMVALTAFTHTAYASAPNTGFTTTALATASLDKPVHVHSDGVRLTTKEATSVRVQQVVFAAGGSSGWHHHPGMVMVVVASGSVTVWDEHCKATMYGPTLANGAAFIESGDEPGQVTSVAGAIAYTTYVVPKVSPPVFRIEDVAPRCASVTAQQ